MPTLELECTEQDKNYYKDHHVINEKGELYYRFFSGAGWVLQQSVFCEVCRYSCSECYEDYRESYLLKIVPYNNRLII